MSGSQTEQIVALTKDVQYLKEKIDAITELLKEFNAGLPKIRTDISIMFDKIKKNEERIEKLETEIIRKSEYGGELDTIIKWVEARQTLEKFVIGILGIVQLSNILLLIKYLVQ